MSGALAELLQAALDRTPGVSEPDGAAWTGADLLALARRTAETLAARGARPDEPVHLVIGNRPEDIGALLGVWLAGAVAVPVHPAAPAETSGRLQRTTRARFAIDRGRLSVLAETPPPERPLLAGGALVVFTSGSTGEPKGVVLGHAQFAGKLAVLGRLLELRPDDVVLVPLRLTFIFGIWASLLALLAGARLIVVPRFSTDVVADALGRSATILAAVPSMLRLLASETFPAAPTLRAILCGGEPLGTALPGAIGEAWPEARLFDLYGLTETGSCDFCLAPADLSRGIGTIGSPTGQVAFRLASRGGPVPSGETGELQIRTPFGMQGYLDDPALTAAAFDGGFFRTGDLARVRPDGRVALVGRIKEIISRGGNKIAPVELENLFGGHPDVLGALCAGVPDERLGETVHLMVVPRPGAALDPDALRDWAATRIERYKLPDAIHLSEALPLGPTGKADRGAFSRLVAGGPSWE